MRRVFKSLMRLAIALPLAVGILVGAFALVDPPVSALMLLRLPLGEPVRHSPVPLSQISPVLAHAVLTAEDNFFCEHDGIDWRAVETAIDEAEAGAEPRGASTLTMQLAKNLFLWPGRSYLRKALEVPIALAIDALWSKRRIIEVYLNIVEWGPGIYGAEAAARQHFGHSAVRLTAREAALLAGALPAPLARNAGRPGPQLRRIARRIETRMAQTQGLFACIGEARPARP